jgi:hypothetical protein
MYENFFEVKVLRVRILSFSFIHKDNLDNPNIDENEINFTYNSNISLKVNIEDELIDIKCSIKVFLPDNKKDSIINLEVLSSYLLKELGKYEISKGEFDIPEEIIEQLVITSISNTRGVLSVKVNETGFKNIILPLIQMEELKQKKPKTKQKKGVQ